MADYIEFLKLMGCSADGGGCCFLLFSCSVMSNFCNRMDCSLPGRQRGLNSQLYTWPSLTTHWCGTVASHA